VEGIIRTERAEGVENDDDLMASLGTARRKLVEWQRMAAPGAAPAALDEAAVVLEAAAGLVTQAETNATDARAARVALDERLREATRELDDLQRGLKGGAAVPPPVRSRLRRAAALLNESAPAHRRRRDFAAAAADAAAAVGLVALAREVMEADRLARLLEQRDDGVSLGRAIGELRRELSEFFDGLGDDGPDDAALAGRAAEARARAATLVRRQDEAIAAQEQAATEARDRLERVWGEGQRLLRLAEDDPLSRRRAGLLAAYEAIRTPADLEKFRGEVAVAERTLTEWVTRVQATRARIGRLRERLPALVDAAQETAGSWHCLAGSVAFIQQRTRDFTAAQAGFAAAHRRREAEALMTQIEAIENDVEGRYEEMRGWAARLAELDAGVTEIIDLTLGESGEPAADEPSPPKRDRALAAVERYRAQARGATRCEDAAMTLQRAADVANRMIV
jgi:hypothetical protein